LLTSIPQEGVSSANRYTLGRTICKSSITRAVEDEVTSVPPLSSREMVSLTALALLNERERHPYDMQREIRSRQKDFVVGLPHSLYRAIDRLAHCPMWTFQTARR
jgi:hypothetical protein